MRDYRGTGVERRGVSPTRHKEADPLDSHKKGFHNSRS